MLPVRKFSQTQNFRTIKLVRRTITTLPILILSFYERLNKHTEDSDMRDRDYNMLKHLYMCHKVSIEKILTRVIFCTTTTTVTLMCLYISEFDQFTTSPFLLLTRIIFNNSVLLILPQFYHTSFVLHPSYNHSINYRMEFTSIILTLPTFLITQGFCFSLGQ